MKPGSLTYTLRWSFSDLILLTKRSVLRTFRTPQLLVFSSIQPVMFLLLFNYVFGGAVSASAGGGDYINFLLPGILAQTAMFGSIQTGVGIAEDLNKGAIDRFRSLPMARGAVLGGRTLADAARNVFVILLMFIVGIALGFTYQNGLLNLILAFLLVLAFGYAVSWVYALVGLLVKDSETAQTAGFLIVFPLVFASAVFVPIDTMPSWLQVFARNQPVTQVVSGVRALMHGGSMDPVWITILWIIGIVAVFAPLAIYRYRKTV